MWRPRVRLLVTGRAIRHRFNTMWIDSMGIWRRASGLRRLLLVIVPKHNTELICVKIHENWFVAEANRNLHLKSHKCLQLHNSTVRARVCVEKNVQQLCGSAAALSCGLYCVYRLAGDIFEPQFTLNWELGVSSILCASEMWHFLYTYKNDARFNNDKWTRSVRGDWNRSRK